MDALDAVDTVTLDGCTIKIPRIQSDKEDAVSSNVLFEKPSWVPDEEATSCFNCKQKFSPLNRKHHCRNCGKIFCSRCCREKACLSQYGMNGPQRVCGSCKITADLIEKSRSEFQYLKNEAAVGLAKLVANTADLCKLIECGGLHILLTLAMDGDDAVKDTVANALHCITQHMVLNTFLVKAGCLQVLKRILDSYSCDQYQIAYDSLSALYLLCQDENIKLQVLKEKMIDPLLVLLDGSGAVSALSSRILLMLIGNSNHMNFILQGHPNLPSSLLKSLKNEDFQMQEAITRILVHVTAGSDACRHTLLQEDEVLGNPLLFLLKGSIPVVLTNSVCIVANLASTPNEQVPTHKYISAFCELLDIVREESVDLITHLGRGLANFAEYPTNSLFLVQRLQSVVSSLLKSNVDVHKMHACRIIVRLLSSEPSYTMHVLSSEGMVPFLETLFSLPGVTEALNTLLLRKVSRLSVRV